MQYFGSINSDSTHKTHSDLPLYDIDGSYKAGESPIKSETGLENMGIAVFNDDKLVGELTGMESLSHLLVVDKFESATISVPDPYNSDSEISLYITPSKNSKTYAKLVNGTPYIECNITLTGNISSLNQDLNYSDEKTLKTIEEYTNSYLEQTISSYLYKTSKEYKSDIGNFGRHVIHNYLTWDDWIESDWLSNYENAFFSVNVDTTIQSSQLYTKI